MNELMQKIHRGNIYENFENILPFQSEDNNISKYLENTFGGFNEKNVTILELGTWKGSSAIAICKHFLAKNIVPTLLTIDTFCGSSFHWMHEEFYQMLKCKNGFPSLYQQFLSNVIHENLQENIIPIPSTTHDAARYLKKLGISADFCYVDAAHEFDEVSQEIQDFWPMVKSGGSLIFDDYDSGWLGVVNAVNDFVQKNNLQQNCQLFHSQFVIHKPKND